MLAHKRNREEDKSDDNSISNKNSSQDKKNFNANFLMKLYQILETPELANIIEWGENGKFFKVKNITEFTEKVLPKFFKHNNFASFVRQLNMYDFHKKRTYNNENIFLHKNFIRGQKNLIKTIKRKNTNNNNNDATKCETGDLLECYQKEFSSKKLTKQSMEKILMNFTKHLEISNERQRNLELKYEELEKKSEEYIVQNQNLMHEISTRSEWTKKLEAIIFLIFDYMKSIIIKNETPTRSAILSGNDSNYLAQISEKKEYKSKSQNDSTRMNTSFFKNHLDNPLENYFIKNLVENLFEYVSEQNSKEKIFNKLESYPMLGERENLPAIENIDYDRYNQQNNVLYLNKNGELVKNIPKSNLREESLFNNNPNINSQLNTLVAKLSSNNLSNIFKVENEIKNQNLNINGNTGLSTTQLQLMEGQTSINPSIPQTTNIQFGKTKSKNSSTNLNKSTSGINTFIHNPNQIDLSQENLNLNNCLNNNGNLFKSISNGSIGINCIPDLKKDPLNIGLNEEEKSIFMRSYKSPNPFEDYSFGQNSNIFNSPNPVEGMMYKTPHDNNEKLNINFDLSRNSSIDYNEIFKSETPDNLEEKRLPKENNLFFDDSFFSISSNEKKSETISEKNAKNRHIDNINFNNK